ncbi:MAG: integrase catalytic domain-containing protein [Candidatus Acidiferrales bacterium]
MHSREQYLERLREEYRNAGKKTKTRLLNEARKRTRLNRKVLIGKLCHPAAVKQKKKGGPRQPAYGKEVLGGLIQVWEIFDYPCGQRLAPALRQEVERLRESKDLVCSDEVAAKLREISPKTIDRMLGREKQVRRLRRNRNPRVHPLLYQKIPVKVASEWDTSEVGNVQVDYVAHCGTTAAGQYLHTISAVDIATGWWEGEAIAGRSQEATKEGLDKIRKRLPFRMREIHPDNDTGLINNLLWNYCQKARIKMSRSRPYQKNDNAWVEQRNWTHVRKVVGYRRMDTTGELILLRELYACLTLYKNFFQPSMKLKEKVRVGGKIHRKYDEPKTPYQRLIESGQIAAAKRKRIEAQYASLNVAGLRRRTEELRTRLFDRLEQKDEGQPSAARRHGPGIRVGGRAHGIWMREMMGAK